MTASQTKTALIVLTSVDRIPGTDRPTGFYMDEMATPYFALRDRGIAIRFATISGGKPPIDPGSLGSEGDRKPNVQRFLDDADAMTALAEARPVAEFDATAFDLVFLPGGHGTMWDFAQSQALAALIGRAFDRGAVIGAVCHGPAGLVSATTASGRPIVEGRKINAFTDSEERAVQLEDTVPYLLESALREKGALFEGTDDFQSHAVRDGRLVTGQNPASVERVADLLIQALDEIRLRGAA
ncbi:MAG: type 1 glutamine amidotransferase domain-containing protein [Pseudomonadota bacterium]